MNFIKEYISAEDAILLNKFKIYDYNTGNICEFEENYIWLVERKEKIYFIHIGGSGNLEQAPQQYDLIWKDKKIVIFKDNYSSYDNWNLCGIYAPTELKSIEASLIQLIKIVLEENHRMGIFHSKITYNTKKFAVNNLNISYHDEVK